MLSSNGRSSYEGTTVDNFEEHWTSIVDSLVEDDTRYDIDQDTQSVVSSASYVPFYSFTADSAQSCTASPASSCAPSTPVRLTHGHHTPHTLSPTAKCFRQEADQHFVPFPDNSPYQPWEQTIAMQSYMFRVQLLTAFMSPEKNGKDQATPQGPRGTEGQSDIATGDWVGDEGMSYDSQLLHLTYRQRTRLNRAEAARRRGRQWQPLRF